MNVHIICGSTPRCGFRVDSEYFRIKKQFAPGICPRCNGPIAVVEAYTEKPVIGAYMRLGKWEDGGGTLVLPQSAGPGGPAGPGGND